MKKLTMKAAFLLLMVYATLSAAADAVTLRIAAEPDTLLPGLAPSLRIWIMNAGGSPVEVPATVALQVIPPRGEPFIAYASMRGDDWTTELVAKGPLVVAPGETRDVSFWSRDEWFGADARFRTTGVFRLQLVADRGLDSEKLSGVTRILDQPGLVQPLVSNEATFTAIEPAGADLAVWNAIQGRSETCSVEVTELIWTQYPSSGYAAYCVRYLNDGDDLKQIGGYEASLAKGPPLYRADAYRLNVALAWISRASGLISRDVEAAVDAYSRAKAILEPLSRNALSVDHQRQATELLELRVRTREQVVERHRASQGHDDRPVRFYATCFEKMPDGAKKVWFGYNNPNSQPIEIPIGEDNKFTPPPFSRKQPTTFEPGIVDFAFNIVTKEPSLAWHLRGKTAHFKVQDSRECPKGFDPNDPSTWQVEE